MARRAHPTAPEVIRRLAAIKMMIVGMNEALPTVRRDLEREAREAIDDLIGDLA